MWGERLEAYGERKKGFPMHIITGGRIQQRYFSTSIYILCCNPT